MRRPPSTPDLRHQRCRKLEVSTTTTATMTTTCTYIAAQRTSFLKRSRSASHTAIAKPSVALHLPWPVLLANLPEAFANLVKGYVHLQSANTPTLTPGLARVRVRMYGVLLFSSLQGKPGNRPLPSGERHPEYRVVLLSPCSDAESANAIHCAAVLGCAYPYGPVLETWPTVHLHRPSPWHAILHHALRTPQTLAPSPGLQPTRTLASFALHFPSLYILPKTTDLLLPTDCCKRTHNHGRHSR